MTIAPATLARALYETDSGTNGYPPLHLSIPWRDVMHKDDYYDRAAEILRLLPLTPKGKR